MSFINGEANQRLTGELGSLFVETSSPAAAMHSAYRLLAVTKHHRTLDICHAFFVRTKIWFLEKARGDRAEHVIMHPEGGDAASVRNARDTGLPARRQLNTEDLPILGGDILAIDILALIRRSGRDTQSAAAASQARSDG